MATLTHAEVAKHSSSDDCWFILNNKVYDVTSFLPDHPGGTQVILNEAGQDCTANFLAAHPESVMKLTLGPKGLEESFRGTVDPALAPQSPQPARRGLGHSSHTSEVVDTGLQLAAVLNLHDFEAMAETALVGSGKKQAWDYYSSGACDESTAVWIELTRGRQPRRCSLMRVTSTLTAPVTYRENINAFHRLWLRPRILVDVKEVDTSCTILGAKCPLPLFLSAVAMCGMGHSDGEIAWMKAAAAAGIVFMVPNLSSKSFDDILGAAEPGQVVHFQIYVNPDRSVVLDQIRACERYGVKALCITVDSAVAGKRERDLRNKIAMEMGRAAQQSAAAKGTVSRKAGKYANRDPALNWSDVAWFKSQTSIPIVLKGVQTSEDALLALKAGVDAILLSNHGGRNCDTSRSGIEVLEEVVAALEASGGWKRRDGSRKMEIWVDGGVRRGTDILKARALGADAVGIGKPAVFAMSAFGAEGIEKAVQILHEELVQGMQLCGAASLGEILPSMVATNMLHQRPIYDLRSTVYGHGGPAAGGGAAEVREAVDSRSALTADVRRKRKRDYLYDLLAPLQPLGLLLLAMLKVVGKTVFGVSNKRAAISSSAVFLVCFVVVHAAGNLTALVSPDAFNKYAHKLHSLDKLLIAIELYLFAGFAVHILVGLWLTYSDRKLKLPPRFSWAAARLAISGLLVLAFVVLHVQHFRFGPWYTTTVDGVEMRDLWRLQKEVFASPMQVGWYTFAACVLGGHLLYGWQKTVRKPQGLGQYLPKTVMPAAEAIGNTMAGVVVLAFVVCPLYTHYLVRGGHC